MLKTRVLFGLAIIAVVVAIITADALFHLSWLIAVILFLVTAGAHIEITAFALA